MWECVNTDVVSEESRHAPGLLLLQIRRSIWSVFIRDFKIVFNPITGQTRVVPQLSCGLETATKASVSAPPTEMLCARAQQEMESLLNSVRAGRFSSETRGYSPPKNDLG